MGGYGGRFAQWVRSDKPQPYNSFGNGAAMRPYWYKYIDEVLDAAAETAKPSHNHDEGIKGAQTVVQTVVLAIFRALQFGSEASQHIKEILTECAEFAKYNINIKKENVINKFDETCQGTVPVALWIIGQSTSFEDAK